jgi:hypothetical protein
VRSRHLVEPETGKTWRTECQAGSLTMVSGAAGRERATSKSCADGPAAEAQAEKEEWSRLKRGFVLSNPAAAAGEPRMLCCLRGPHTGALVAEDVAGRLLCNRAGDLLGSNALCLIDEDARLADTIELPPSQLAWKALHVPELQRLLVRADHRVLAWSWESRRFDALTGGNRQPASFLSRAGTVGAWYAEPDVVVTDLRSGAELMRRGVPSETYGGHTPQMEGALAPDGHLLACCAKAGQILLFDVPLAGPPVTMDVDTQMIDKMAFTPDGRQLIALERYGQWRLWCFDLETRQPRAGWPELDRMERGDFAIEPRGNRIAIARGAQVEIFDLLTMGRSSSFRADHVVKRSALAWVGRYLGMRTDAGAASLYAVD